MRRTVLKGIWLLALGVLAYGICKTPTYALDYCALNPITSAYTCQRCDSAISNCSAGYDWTQQKSICNNAWGCTCNWLPIANGTTCMLAGDGIRTAVSHGQGCSDLDGCTCGAVWYTFNINFSDQCTRTTTPPTLTAGAVTPSSSSASFVFTSDQAGTITYQWACGVGSLSNAIAGSNTTTFTLAAGTYNTCTIKVTDTTYGNISSPLAIPAFVISAGTWVTPPPAPSWGWGTRGWGWASYSSFSSDCTTSDVVCTDGKYIRKDNSQCFAGLTWKPCAMDLTWIVAGIKNLTMTSLADLIDSTKNNKTITTVSEVTIQWVKVKFYVPKYKTAVIRNVIASLNSSIKIAIGNKLKKVSDPSYLIENYNLIGTDVKLIAYKEIGTLMKWYNDFLAVFYLIIDKGRSDLLPIGQFQLKAFLNNYITFKK